MNNARTKYMAQLVAEVFNVQEYEASVSLDIKTLLSSFVPSCFNYLKSSSINISRQTAIKTVTQQTD